MLWRRSGGAVVLFPTHEIEESGKKPQLFMIGGLDTKHNQAQDSTEYLDHEAAMEKATLEEGAEFELGFLTSVRRGYCAAAVVTVSGDIGRPDPIEERMRQKKEQEEQEKQRRQAQDQEQVPARQQQQQRFR